MLSLIKEAIGKLREYITGKAFVQLLEDDALLSRDEAFQRTFVSRHSRCFADGSDELLEKLVELGLFNWKDINLEDLARTIHEIESVQAVLEENISSTLARCQEILPMNRDLPVWILPGDSRKEHFKQMNGLSAAYIESADGVIVVISPIDGWLEYLQPVLAHEYHHVALRDVKGNFSETFVEGVIAEGLADDFAGRLYPERKPSWANLDFDLTPEQELEAYQYLYQRLDPRFEEQNPMLKTLFDSQRHQRLFLFGTYPGESPMYTGYAIAYRIVQGFVSSHDISLDDLMNIEPEVIVKESTYHPSCK